MNDLFDGCNSLKEIKLYRSNNKYYNSVILQKVKLQYERNLKNIDLVFIDDNSVEFQNFNSYNNNNYNINNFNSFNNSNNIINDNFNKRII